MTDTLTGFVVQVMRMAMPQRRSRRRYAAVVAVAPDNEPAVPSLLIGAEDRQPAGGR